MPVLGAGLLEAQNGQLTMINESSGHYRPDAEHLHASLEAMQEAGQSLSYTTTADGMTGECGTDIQLTGAVSTDGRLTGKSWIRDEGLPEETVHLRPDQFLQTGATRSRSAERSPSTARSRSAARSTPRRPRT
jgi:hypothetical protein